MSATKLPRLLYFDARGRGELTRILFAAGNLDYEDVRIKVWSKDNMMVSPDFQKIKESLPLGQLPVLEWGGMRLAQSVSIARFVAKQARLTGRDDVQDLKIDMLVDLVTDHFKGFLPLFGWKDEFARKKRLDRIMTQTVPDFLDKSEELLKMAGGKHFVDDRVTLADIAMMERLSALVDPEDPLFKTHYDWLTTGGQSERIKLLSKYPLLDSLRERVYNVPEIKKYMDSRPSSNEPGF